MRFALIRHGRRLIRPVEFDLSAVRAHDVVEREDDIARMDVRAEETLVHFHATAGDEVTERFRVGGNDDPAVDHDGIRDVKVDDVARIDGDGRHHDGIGDESDRGFAGNGDALGRRGGNGDGDED